MYQYRNVKTGVVISTPCPVKGDWELIEEKKKEEPKPKTKKK